MSEQVAWSVPRNRSTAFIVFGSGAFFGGLIASMAFLVIGLFSSLVWVYLSIAVFVLGPIAGVVLLLLGWRETKRRWTFNPPPGWPASPPGWLPPHGWRPDPDWSNPPPDWRYWLTK
jgi:MFS family permease